MTELKERIRYVRKEVLKMKHTEFSEMLGVSTVSTSYYEAGTRTPSNAVLKIMADKAGINETWLLTGEGEMKAPSTKEQEVASLASMLYGIEQDSFEYQVFMYLKDMPIEDWQAFQRFVRNVVKKIGE